MKNKVVKRKEEVVALDISKCCVIIWNVTSVIFAQQFQMAVMQKSNKHSKETE